MPQTIQTSVRKSDLTGAELAALIDEGVAERFTFGLRLRTPAGATHTDVNEPDIWQFFCSFGEGPASYVCYTRDPAVADTINRADLTRLPIVRLSGFVADPNLGIGQQPLMIDNVEFLAF